MNEFDSVGSKQKAAFLFLPLEKKIFLNVHGLHITGLSSEVVWSVVLFLNWNIVDIIEIM